MPQDEQIIRRKLAKVKRPSANGGMVLISLDHDCLAIQWRELKVWLKHLNEPHGMDYVYFYYGHYIFSPDRIFNKEFKPKSAWQVVGRHGRFGVKEWNFSDSPYE